MPKKKEVVEENVVETPTDVSNDEQVTMITDLEKRVLALELEVNKLKAKPSPSKPIPEVPSIVEPVGEKLRWVKKGGGSFRLANGRIIKPGQTFEATAAEIPSGVRDIVVPAGGAIIPETNLVSATKYKIVPKGIGWFDVVNIETEKPVNEKGLREDDANKLLQDLN